LKNKNVEQRKGLLKRGAKKLSPSILNDKKSPLLSADFGQDPERQKILVLEKAFLIQEFMTDYPQGISLGTLSAKIKMNKSTVYRILDTLHSMGYIVKKSSGNYCLGYKYFIFTQSILDMHLKQIALPYMRQLAEKTGEIVHFAIEENHQMVFIEEIVPESTASITIKSFLGKRGSLHSTAVGKAYLSTLKNKEIEEILFETGLPAYTRRTITDSAKLISDIEKTRRRGYSIDDLENVDAIRSVAAPIMDIQGNSIGAVDIAGTVFSITSENLEEMGLAVKEYTAKISGDLGLNRVMRRVGE
jgi:DNA-binding IclR family transcriptional regulator